jgi:hypothetical protein
MSIRGLCKIGLLLFLVEGAQIALANDCEDYEDRSCRDAFVSKHIPPIHAYNPDVQCADADATCQSDARKYQEITATIEKAKEQDDAVHDAMEKLKKAQSGHVFDWTSFDSWKRGLASEVFQGPTAESDAAKALSAARDKQFALYNHAIAETIELYHLVPKGPYSRRHSDGSEPMRAWAPHYAAQEHRDENGNSVPFTDEDKIKLWRKYGQKIPDGTKNLPDPIVSETDIATDNIGVFAGAFYDPVTKKISPNLLALYILHETVHWVDFQALGHKPNPAEKFHSEIAAYQAEIDAAPSLGIADTKLFKSYQVTYKFQSDHAPLTYGELYGDKKYENWAPANNVDVPDDSRAKEIDQVVDGAIDNARKLAWEQQMKAQVEAEHRTSDRYLRSSLRDIAFRACAHGPVTPDDLQSLPWRFDPNFYKTIPPSEFDGNLCATLLFEKLGAHLSFGGALDVKMVSDMTRDIQGSITAAPYAPLPGPAPTPPAARTHEDIRRWTEYFEAQVKIMKDIVQSACSSGARLSSDDARRFDEAYSVLYKRDYHSVSGYGPKSALTGLSGCDLDVMKELLDADYDPGVDVPAIWNKYRSTAPTLVVPDRTPNRNPQFQGHCAVWHNGVCVYRAD